MRSKPDASGIYQTLVRQSRHALFYTKYGIPDTKHSKPEAQNSLVHGLTGFVSGVLYTR